MKAKTLARLNRYAEASAALEESLKIDPSQSIPDLKSPRDLMAQPEVPAGIVCGSKSEHDFQKISVFSISMVCSNFCGRIQLFQQTIYRCARCGYTVHAQCLPMLKFMQCYGEKKKKEDEHPIQKVIKQSGAACEGVCLRPPSPDTGTSRHYDSDDDEAEQAGEAREGGRRRNIGSTHRRDSMEGIYEERVRSSKVYPNVAKERYVVTHVHAMRPGIPYFENCHACSKVFRIGESSVRCVKCRKIFHSSCIESASPCIMLHPSEFL